MTKLEWCRKYAPESMQDLPDEQLLDLMEDIYNEEHNIKTPNIIPEEYKDHYRGIFGECDYDTRMFELRKGAANIKYLHYKVSCTESVYIPDGYNSCYRMFYDCSLPEGFTLGDKFDTSNVTNMSYMFTDCTLPEGFTLGDKFDTSNVTDMSHMFSYCELPEGFTLGDKFDTSKVANMSGMFKGCILPKGFSLGDKFKKLKCN